MKLCSGDNHYTMALLLPKISSKGTGKAFLVKIKNHNDVAYERPFKVKGSIQNPHTNQVKKLLVYI